MQTVPSNKSYHGMVEIYDSAGLSITASMSVISIYKNGTNTNSTTGSSILTASGTGQYRVSLILPFATIAGDTFCIRIRAVIGSDSFYRTLTFIVGISTAATAPSAASIRTEMDNNSSKLSSMDSKLTTLQSSVNDVPTLVEFTGRTILSSQYFDPSNDTVLNVANVTNKTGYSLTQAFPANFSSLDIEATGEVTSTNAAPSAASIRTEIDNNSSKLSSILADTGTTLDSKLTTLQSSVNNVPTVSEFNARTLLASSYFDAANDTVASVTNVYSVVDKTGYSLTQAFPANFSSLDIEATGEVTSTNGGGGGTSTHTAQNVADLILSTPANKLLTDGTGKVTSTNAAPSAASIRTEMDNNSSKLSSILADTGATLDGKLTSLQASVDNVPTVAEFNARTLLASAYFDASSDTVANVTNVIGKTGYSLSQAFPTNFSSLDIEAVTGKVTTSNPASGAGSSHTASDVASLILATPANKLATDASGKVTIPNTLLTSADITSQTAAINNNTNAKVNALNDFDHATDTVANVTNVTNKTGYSLTQAFPTNFSVLDIQVGTGKVTTANPASGSGSSHTAADVADLILNTPANKLVTDGNGKVNISNTLLTSADITAQTTLINTNTNTKVNALNDFDHATDTIANVTNVTNKTGYSLTQAFPTNFSSLDIEAVTGKVTSTNGGGGGSSTHTASDVANLILATPANKLLTDGTGKVTTSNPASGGGSAHTAADVAGLILNTPANKLVTDGNGKVTISNTLLTSADITSQTTAINNNTNAKVNALNDFDPATDPVANVTDKSGYSLTQAFPTNFSVLDIEAVTGEVTSTNGGGGGGGGGVTQGELDTSLATQTTAINTKIDTINVASSANPPEQVVVGSSNTWFMPRRSTGSTIASNTLRFVKDTVEGAESPIVAFDLNETYDSLLPVDVFVTEVISTSVERLTGTGTASSTIHGTTGFNREQVYISLSLGAVVVGDTYLAKAKIRATNGNILVVRGNLIIE